MGFNPDIVKYVQKRSDEGADRSRITREITHNANWAIEVSGVGAENFITYALTRRREPMRGAEGGLDMTIPNDNLRLYLGFLNRLEQVQVTAATNVIGSNLRVLGVVEGKEKLRELLEKAGIDHYVISSGDLVSGTFSSVAYAMTPAGIVDALDREFQKEDNILMRILQGGPITEEEKHFSPRTSLTVCSASVKTEDGLAVMKGWLSGQKP